MNHKRGRPKNARAGCLMCKPWKVNGAKNSHENIKAGDRREMMHGVEGRARRNQTRRGAQYEVGRDVKMPKVSCNSCSGRYDCSVRSTMRAIIEGYRGYWFLMQRDKDVWIRCTEVEDKLSDAIGPLCISYYQEREYGGKRDGDDKRQHQA